MQKYLEINRALSRYMGQSLRIRWQDCDLNLTYDETTQSCFTVNLDMAMRCGSICVSVVKSPVLCLWQGMRANFRCLGLFAQWFKSKAA